jgi:hypothetical protein
MPNTPWPDGITPAMRKKEHKQCMVCGQTFYQGTDGKPAFARRKYCGRVCQGIARKQDTLAKKEALALNPSTDPADIKRCGQCNQDFNRGRIAQSSWRIRKYCSKVCLNEARRLGKICAGRKDTT